MTRFTLIVPTLALILSTVTLAGGTGGPPPGVTVLGGCVPGFVQPSPDRLDRQLSMAQTRWKASGIQAYSFDFDQIAQPVRFALTRITVQPGDQLNAATPDGSPPSSVAQTATVRGLFGNIAQSIAFARRQPCVELKVSYAPDGHPISLSLEQRNRNIADGGASWTVSNFKRLK